MYKVDVYLRVRRAVMVDGMSMREAARGVRPAPGHGAQDAGLFGPAGLSPADSAKEAQAGALHRRHRPDPGGRLKASQEATPHGQAHLRAAAGRVRFSTAGYTTVKDYVRENRRQTREMFVPLSQSAGPRPVRLWRGPGGHRGGVERKAHCFVIDLPHSDGCFVKAYPAETTEAFLDGHVSAFAYLGSVPQSILYDNTKLAVARILGDGQRQRTRAFTELQSHYLFEDRFGRPGKGNDKGKVEGLVGYVRRNFLVPIPSFESFDALNAYLNRRCLERMDAQLRGPHGDHRSAYGAGPGRPVATACGALRRLR